jgi:dinuclear metal center YbgI/SA1388 family protein
LRRRCLTGTFFLTMTPSVADIIRIIEAVAPPDRAEPWDNCGLQVGSPDAAVVRTAVALDADEGTINSAAAGGADLLVTHHPLIFPDIASIDTRRAVGRAIAAALKADIAVYSAHTSLDHAPGGTSLAAARRLSLIEPAPLPSPSPGTSRPDRPGTGDGILCIGRLPMEMKLVDLANLVKDSLGAPLVRIVGDPSRVVSRVAVCAGSGGGYIGTAHGLDAEVLITGEVRYHAAREAADLGISVIEAGHFWSELPVLSEIARIITQESRAKGWSVDVTIMQEQDPFSYV